MRSVRLARSAVQAAASAPAIARAPCAASIARCTSVALPQQRVCAALTACRFSTAAAAKASMAQIKALRETSGAPITECRDAIQGVLNEGKTDGSDGAVMAAAVEWLRKKGISTAAKKSGRAASEGLVSVALVDGGRAASLVEVNSETDFAARNATFQQLAVNISHAASQLASQGTVDLAALQAAPCPDAVDGSATTVATAVTNIVSSLRENIHLRRATSVRVQEGVIGTYMHNAVTFGEGEAAVKLPSGANLRFGRQGALVGLETSTPVSTEARAELTTLANKLAMQVVAATPRYVNRTDIEESVIEKERAVLTEQARAPPQKVPGQAEPKAPAKPKSDQQIAMMVQGRINKWLGEIVLVDQPVVVAGDWDMAKPPTVGAILKQQGEKFKTQITVTGMARFLVGEGVAVTKDADSFRKEVEEKMAKAKAQ